MATTPKKSAGGKTAGSKKSGNAMGLKKKKSGH